MNDDEDDILALLNGINTSSELRHRHNHHQQQQHQQQLPLQQQFSSEGVFLDENGLPTDSFLQSLKEPTKNYSPPSYQPSVEKQKVLTEYKFPNYSGNYFPDTTSDDESEDMDTPAPPLATHYSHLRRRVPIEVTRPTTPTTTSCKSRSKSRLKLKRSTSHSPTTLPSNRLYDSTIQNIKKEKKQSRSSTPIPPAPTPTTTTTTAASAVLTSSIETFRQSGSGDNEKKSLQLRLQGQLQSIRVLETQLTEATQIIVTKDQQLREVMKRLQAMELKEKKRLKRELDERQQQHGSTGNERLKLEERKVLQLQHELSQMESKYQEELLKRQRSEERVQVMKNYIQKNKDKSLVTESQLATRDEMIETLHQKFNKIKKDMKNLQEVFSNETKKRIEIEKERDQERERRERAERLNRELRNSTEHIKEELCSLRQELHSKEEKERRNRLEMEILRERERSVGLKNSSNLMKKEVKRPTVSEELRGNERRRSTQVKVSHWSEESEGEERERLGRERDREERNERVKREREEREERLERDREEREREKEKREREREKEEREERERAKRDREEREERVREREGVEEHRQTPFDQPVKRFSHEERYSSKKKRSNSLPMPLKRRVTEESDHEISQQQLSEKSLTDEDSLENYSQQHHNRHKQQEPTQFRKKIENDENVNEDLRELQQRQQRQRQRYEQNQGKSQKERPCNGSHTSLSRSPPQSDEGSVVNSSKNLVGGNKMEYDRLQTMYTKITGIRS